MEHEDHWCMAWLADAPHVEGNEKAALIKDCKWVSADTITISFLDGDPELHEKVIEVAKRWIAPGMANLAFQFRDDTQDTHIRISFQYKGSWSVLGNTCKKITDLSQPTMNFGWLTKDSTELEIQRVVLHEFGHALGLTHEHLSPAEGIKWNKEQVRKDLKGGSNKWDDETINRNMFDRPSEDETNYTELDRHSIMMYPIPARWTEDGFSVGLNTDLSAMDKQFIGEQYP